MHFYFWVNYTHNHTTEWHTSALKCFLSLAPRFRPSRFLTRCPTTCIIPHGGSIGLRPSPITSSSSSCHSLPLWDVVCARWTGRFRSSSRWVFTITYSQVMQCCGVWKPPLLCSIKCVCEVEANIGMDTRNFFGCIWLKSVQLFVVWTANDHMKSGF